MSLSENQLQTLINAMPNMVGFSIFDGPYIESALQQLSAEERKVLEVVMEKGSHIEAARTIGDGESGKTAEAFRQMKDALASLRRKFNDVLDALP